MAESPGSSSFGNHPANLAVSILSSSKIRRVIAKEWQASSSAARCSASRVKTSRKRFKNRGKYERGRAEPLDIRKARGFIDEHFDEHLSLPKVARAVNINANYLSEKFKQVTNVKFVDYIARTRFEKARRLLDSADLRITEIAFAVGFQSLSQFNRVFQKFSGKSPTEYRSGSRAKRQRR